MQPVPFSSLGLAEPILAAITAEGYENPTPIQAKTIPPALEGRDVLGCAQTGTGKTAAFALPILHKLVSAQTDEMMRERRPRALILSPTRELATQIADSFRTYGRNTRVSGTTIFGGVSQRGQVRDLQRGVDVVVATPGRLLDLLDQGYVDLSAVETFVLDEADRMLDMGFIAPIRQIAAKLPASGSRQTLLFSATMPKEIQKLAESLLTNPVRVAVTPVASAAPKIEQRLFMVPRLQKLGLLLHLLEAERAERAVVFSKTKHGADKLCKRLDRAGVSAVAIHGNKAQNARDRALDAFRRGQARILVATDVAARGLDVDGITHVFNFDLPMEPEAYVHRIGRTGRAGASGVAISFCDREERDLLRQIERLLNNRIPTFPLPEGVELNTPRDDFESRDDDRHMHDRRPTHVPSSSHQMRGPRPERRMPPHHPEHPQNNDRQHTPRDTGRELGFAPKHQPSHAPMHLARQFTKQGGRFSSFLEDNQQTHAPKRAPRQIERLDPSARAQHLDEFAPRERRSDRREGRPNGPGHSRSDGRPEGRPEGKPNASKFNGKQKSNAPKNNPDKGKPKWAKGGKGRTLPY